LLLLEPEPTPADLRFRIFGVAVRVHPMFWLVAALLGWSWQQLGLVYVLIWIGCVFVSILVHEFGHVWMGNIFGSPGHIVLYSFGGLAIGSKNLSDRWKRIAVSAAGPLIQFVPCGIAWLAARNYVDLVGRDFAVSDAGKKLAITLVMLRDINLFWPLLNLLPIWPLDGGQISREVFDFFSPGRGIRTALGISMVVAGIIAANAIISENRGEPLIPYLPVGWYSGILFGMLAFSSFQTMQQIGAANPWGQDGAPWERDPDAWRR
jgi:Zn-dependent protease